VVNSHEDHGHEHSHDVQPAVEGLDVILVNSYKPQEHWFDAPVKINEDQYLVRDIPLQSAASCQDNSVVRANKNFADNIVENYGHDVATTDASETFFKSLTQFFLLEEKYWQITLIWENDMPAVYRFEIFSSNNKNFDQDVHSQKSPIDFPKYADALASEAWLNQTLAYFVARGAQPGSRIVEQRVMDEKGKSHEWVAQNGDLVSWQFDSGVCLLDKSGAHANCVCDKS